MFFFFFFNFYFFPDSKNQVQGNWGEAGEGAEISRRFYQTPQTRGEKKNIPHFPYFPHFPHLLLKLSIFFFPFIIFYKSNRLGEVGEIGEMGREFCREKTNRCKMFSQLGYLIHNAAFEWCQTLTTTERTSLKTQLKFFFPPTWFKIEGGRSFHGCFLGNQAFFSLWLGPHINDKWKIP